MKVLITGSSGFIGRNLVELLRERYTIFAPGSAELNLLDAPAVRDYLTGNRFDAVVHAATTRANRRLGAPPDIVESNCRMFFNLARNEHCFGKMIHFGSGAEYGVAELPSRVGEQYFDTCVPTDPYGFSKYLCAKYIERAERIINLRLFAVFGKYEAWEVRFISNACCRILRGFPVVIRQNVKFDYLYVNDLAAITSWFIENDGRKKTYNVCGGKGYLLTELACILSTISGHHEPVVVKNTGLGREYTGDNSRLLSELGEWQFTPVEDAIRELYEWYAGHAGQIDDSLLHFDE